MLPFINITEVKMAPPKAYAFRLVCEVVFDAVTGRISMSVNDVPVDVDGNHIAVKEM